MNFYDNFSYVARLIIVSHVSHSARMYVDSVEIFFNFNFVPQQKSKSI